MQRTALFLLLVSCSLSAQITLTSEDFLKFNTQITRHVAQLGSLQPGPAGANQTWDFSTLVKTGETESLTLKRPSDTPHAATFPQATLSEEFPLDNGNSAWTYWKVTPTEYTLVGLIAVADEGTLTVPYSDFENIMDLPINFGNSKTDTFAATFSSFGAQVSRTGNSTTTYDAYGTLKLPRGTITNVARLKNNQHIEDRISVAGQNIVTITDTQSYTWHIKDEPWPLLTYSSITNTVEIAGFPNVTTTTLIRFQDVEGNDNNPQPTANRWISHLTAPNGGFETTLFLLNLGNQSEDIKLQPYGSNGGSLTEKEVTIPVNQLVTVDAASYFNGESVSHFSIAGAEKVSVTTGYKSAVGQGATAHLHDSAATGTSFRVYPGERGVIFDGMAAVNTGTETATITARMVNESGMTVASITLTDSLAPGAKFLQVFENVFPNNQDTVIVINSDQPLSVLFLRGSKVGSDPAYLYANQVQTTPGSNRWIPHVTRVGGGFQTKFFFDNPGAAASVTLQPYSSDGTALQARTVNVGAQRLDIRTHEELFGTDDVSHFSISGSSAIVVTAGYRSIAEEGATAHVHEAPQVGRSFRVFTGERELVFDGMAIVNVGNANATLQAQQIDSNGNVLANIMLTDNLAPHAKYLNVFDALFSEIPNTTIRITSDQDVSVVFLRGTPVGVTPAYLYSNPAINE